MKKIYIILFVLFFNFISVNTEEVNCDSAINKLKPACNLGKVFKGMEKFSKNHKTIGQYLGLKKITKTNIKSFAEKHKTIGQSIGLDNKNSKLKKFDKENKTLKDLFKNYIK